MAIKINWDKIKRLHEDLTKEGWEENDPLLFITVTPKGTPKKTIVKFKDFLTFFWQLTSTNVITFIVQDNEGKILYRHKIMAGKEEIPNDGNLGLILKWPSMTPDQKSTYLRILISQINAYDNQYH